MAKTKKNIKRDKIIKNKNTNNVKFNNTGLTEFIYKEGNQSPKKMIIKWDDDGNNTKIHVNTNIHGKEKETTLNLSNDKIKELLGPTKVVDQPIDQRLINDFSIMSPIPIQQPFNEQILFLTEEPIMSDIDIIPMSFIKNSKNNTSKNKNKNKSKNKGKSKSKK